MKAAIFRGDGRATVEEAETPDLRPGEVLLQLEGCGVCASNLPVWQGREWFDYPLVPGSPGHEPWGRVLACGKRVDGFEPGTRVTGLSYRAYAELDVALADQLVVIPEDYETLPFPGEAFACGMNVFRRAGIERDMRVAVVGSGFIGGLVIQLAAAAGASVTAFSRRPWSRRLAADQGAIAVRSFEDGAGEALRSAFERVVECTGAQRGLDVASTLTAPGGRLVIAGYHQEGLRTVDLQEWNWKGIDVINAHERDSARVIDGLRAALGAMERRELDPWPLITHRFGLEEIGDAFRTMEDRPEGFTKGVLCL